MQLSAKLGLRRGIDPQTVAVLATEVFCRTFKNRTSVASYVELTPTPYNRAVICDTAQERGYHLCIPEYGDPFAELKVCCYDDAGLLIKLADQVKEQRPTRFWEFGADHDVAYHPEDDTSEQTGGAQCSPVHR